MDELIQTIADQKGYPADLVVRSAAARAQADGVSTDDIIRAWAGVGDAPAAAAAPVPAAAAPAPEAPAESAEPAESTGPKVEVLAPEAPAGAEGEPAEGGETPEPVEELGGALAGFPRWLAAAFIVLPSIALLYVLVLPSGPQCGSAGALAIDPSTGVAENCDGSEFGSDANDVFAVGSSIYSAQCASCHGGNGGGGVGPAFTNGAVLATFSACTDHIEWVLIGSSGWPDATYGDNATPVSGGMPGFPSLSPEDLASVVLYERVAFGGEDRAASEASCFPDAELTAAGE